MFLTKFVLPRETEKIDRVMSAFAHKYYLDNPKLFKNEGTVAQILYIYKVYEFTVVRLEQNSEQLHIIVAKALFC